MPELITKYPDVALKILKDAHIACGVDAPQTILKTCPKKQFCALPTGELCVYGVKQISQMTQLDAFNFIFTPSVVISMIGFVTIIFLIGFWCGSKLKI